MKETEQRVVAMHNALANLTQLYGGMIQDCMLTIVDLRSELATKTKELEALKAKASNGHVPVEQSV